MIVGSFGEIEGRGSDGDRVESVRKEDGVGWYVEGWRVEEMRGLGIEVDRRIDGGGNRMFEDEGVVGVVWDAVEGVVGRGRLFDELE